MAKDECPQGGSHDWGQQVRKGSIITVCSKCGARA
jgi:hypothetical protein